MKRLYIVIDERGKSVRLRYSDVRGLLLAFVIAVVLSFVFGLTVIKQGLEISEYEKASVLANSNITMGNNALEVQSQEIIELEKEVDSLKEKLRELQEEVETLNN